ncbi:MAG: hypothetical protein K6G84_03475 [Lachnospiraceae bacterium]|nr:hypothetical protein [Lachnospiraceae bacterium]
MKHRARLLSILLSSVISFVSVTGNVTYYAHAEEVMSEDTTAEDNSEEQSEEKPEEEINEESEDECEEHSEESDSEESKEEEQSEPEEHVEAESENTEVENTEAVSESGETEQTEAAPEAEMPSEAAPSEAAPTEAMPTEAASTEAAPSEAAPNEAMPTEAAPSEAMPTEAAPSEAMPTEAAPSEAMPTEAAPSEAAPTEAPTSEAVPSEETSENDVAADETVNFELPTENNAIDPDMLETSLAADNAGHRTLSGKAKYGESIVIDLGKTFSLGYVDHYDFDQVDGVRCVPDKKWKFGQDREYATFTLEDPSKINQEITINCNHWTGFDYWSISKRRWVTKKVKEENIEISITFNLDTPKIEFPDMNATYNGSEVKFAENIKVPEGVTYHSVYLDENENELASAPVNAGNYKIKVNTELNKDYKDTEETRNFTIEKADLNVTGEWYNGTYDGAAHPVVSNVAVKGVDGQAVKCSVDEIPVVTEPGEKDFTIGIISEDANYNNTSISGKATVNKADYDDSKIEVTASDIYYKSGETPSVTVKYAGEIVPAESYSVKYGSDIDNSIGNHSLTITLNDTYHNVKDYTTSYNVFAMKAAICKRSGKDGKILLGYGYLTKDFYEKNINSTLNITADKAIKNAILELPEDLVGAPIEYGRLEHKVKGSLDVTILCYVGDKDAEYYLLKSGEKKPDGIAGDPKPKYVSVGSGRISFDAYECNILDKNAKETSIDKYLVSTPNEKSKRKAIVSAGYSEEEIDDMGLDIKWYRIINNRGSDGYHVDGRVVRKATGENYDHRDTFHVTAKVAGGKGTVSVSSQKVYAGDDSEPITFKVREGFIIEKIEINRKKTIKEIEINGEMKKFSDLKIDTYTYPAIKNVSEDIDINVSITPKKTPSENSTSQNSTSQNSTSQNSTSQNSTSQNSTSQNSTSQNSTSQNSTSENSTSENSTSGNLVPAIVDEEENTESENAVTPEKKSEEKADPEKKTEEKEEKSDSENKTEDKKEEKAEPEKMAEENKEEQSEPEKKAEENKEEKSEPEKKAEEKKDEDKKEEKSESDNKAPEKKGEDKKEEKSESGNKAPEKKEEKAEDTNKSDSNSNDGKKKSHKKKKSSSTTASTAATTTASTEGSASAQENASSEVLGERKEPNETKSEDGVLGDKKSPDTGDGSNPLLWLTLLLASGAGIFTRVNASIRKKEEE